MLFSYHCPTKRRHHNFQDDGDFPSRHPSHSATGTPQGASRTPPTSRSATSRYTQSGKHHHVAKHVNRPETAFQICSAIQRHQDLEFHHHGHRYDCAINHHHPPAHPHIQVLMGDYNGHASDWLEGLLAARALLLRFFVFI